MPLPRTFRTSNRKHQALCLPYLIAIAAFALVFFSAAAQTGAPGGTANLDGRVVNAITNEPVPLAHVALQSSAPPLTRVTVTDSHGNFSLRNIQPGQYSVNSERSEFMRGKYGSVAPDQPGKLLALEAGQRLEGLTIALTPLGVIAGSIQAEDGEAMPGLQVNAIRCGTENPSPVGRTFTNDLGQYRLHGLPPGRYCVSATYRGARPSPSDNSSEDRPRGVAVFYPHATTPSDATILNVAPGSTVSGIDFGFSVRTNILRAAEVRSAKGTASIRGEVVNATSGEAVRGAEVELETDGGDSATFETTTDGAGNYVLDELPSGEYRITASHNGFLSDEYGAGGGSGRGKKISVVAGQALDHVNVGLLREGVIAGRVLETDIPLPNAIVMAVHATYVDNKRHYVLVTRAYTDDLGAYRLSGLAPGQYYLSTTYRDGLSPGSSPPLIAGSSKSAPGAAPDTAVDMGVDINDWYATTYYPQALSLSEAATLQVIPGSTQAAIDLPIFRVPKIRITGRVILQAGRAANRNVTVSLIPRDPGSVVKFSQKEASVGPSGRFDIRGVSPGSYILSADWTGENGGFAARQPLEIGRDNIDNVSLMLTPDLRVDGRIILAQTDPVNLAAVQVSLQSTDDLPLRGSGGSSMVSANGAFHLEHLRPGRYLVRLSGLSEDYYLESISVGGESATRSELELVRDTARLALTISAHAGKVRGIVLNDQQQQVESATIALIPEPGLRSYSELYKSAFSDADGTFHLDGIPPGDYKIFAWGDIANLSYQDPDVIALYESQGRALTVKESSSQQIQLNVISSNGAR